MRLAICIILIIFTCVATLIGRFAFESQDSTLERTSSINLSCDVKSSHVFLQSDRVYFIAVDHTRVSTAVASIELALYLVVVDVALSVTFPSENADLGGCDLLLPVDEINKLFPIVIAIVNERWRWHFLVGENFIGRPPSKPIGLYLGNELNIE